MVEIFSKHKCSLGEGIYFESSTNELYWVDIMENQLFSKSLNSILETYDYCITLDSTPSAILRSNNKNCICLVTDKWVGELNIITKSIEILMELNLPKSFRTNDAGYNKSGDLWIGIMERHPTGLNGYIEVYNRNNILVNTIEKIGIPNTIVEDQSGRMIISDSYVKKMYALDLIDGYYSLVEYIDLKRYGGTPDGGVLDKYGNLFFSLWGSGLILVANTQGKIIQQYSLPVPQVSNCCFDSSYNHLFVTSAKEGLNNEQLLQYPLSGCVFKLSIDKT